MWTKLWLSIPEAAREVDLSTKDIRDAIRLQLLPARNIGTGQRIAQRVNRDDLLAWAQGKPRHDTTTILTDLLRRFLAGEVRIMISLEEKAR